MLKKYLGKLKICLDSLKTYTRENREITLVIGLSVVVMILGIVVIELKENKSNSKFASNDNAKTEENLSFKPIDSSSNENDVSTNALKNEEEPQPNPDKSEDKSVAGKSIPTPIITPKPVLKPLEAQKPTSKNAVLPSQNNSPAPTESNFMLDLVNKTRLAEGLTTVKYNAKLNQAALDKAKDMYEKKYFGHIGPDDHNDFYFVKLTGYRYSAVGSNIAKGRFKDDKAVFDAWMTSLGHRANILASYGREIGYAKHSGYYVFIIAKPN